MTQLFQTSVVEQLNLKQAGVQVKQKRFMAPSGMSQQLHLATYLPLMSKETLRQDKNGWESRLTLSLTHLMGLLKSKYRSSSITHGLTLLLRKLSESQPNSMSKLTLASLAGLPLSLPLILPTLHNTLSPLLSVSLDWLSKLDGWISRMRFKMFVSQQTTFAG